MVASEPPKAPACDLTGAYRLRFHSNNNDGWWLRLLIENNRAEIAAPEPMLGLKLGPIDTKVEAGCGVTLSQHTKDAGDLRITFAVDAQGAVTGQLTRTDDYNRENPTSPIVGRRETTAPVLPACLRPGFFRLAALYAPEQKWKIDGHPGGVRGRPRPSRECPFLADGTGGVVVMVEPLGGELLIDEADRGSDRSYQQTFGRAEVTRTGDCSVTLSLQVTDFSIQSARLVFDGDKLSGVAGEAKLDMFEDGEAGENMWSCIGRDITLVGERVGDLPATRYPSKRPAR